MTIFQARFVQWLTLKGCSLRATAGYFAERYDRVDGEYVQTGNVYDSTSSDLFSPSGNQLDGIFIREKAIHILNQQGVEPHFYTMGEFKNKDGTLYVPSFVEYDPQREYQELRTQMKQADDR